MSEIVIFSDLHLRSKEDENYQLFLKILNEISQQNPSEIWLLGDIFDVMIGPFHYWVEKHQEFFDRFRSLSKQNVKLLWIEGNHDFFIRELAQKHGFDVCDGQLIKNIHGKKVYLAHGDLVDSSDLSYLKWRNFTRNKTIRRIIKCFPSNFAAKKIESIGKKLSEQSRKRKAYWKVKLEEQKKIFQDFAVEKIHHGFHGVFLGHSHIPELHRENTRGFYLNLGSWTGRTASYALWDPINDEVPRVINYSLKGA